MADPRLSERLRQYEHRLIELNILCFEKECEGCKHRREKAAVLKDAARLAELHETAAALDAELRHARERSRQRGDDDVLSDIDREASAAVAALLAFDLSGGSQTGRDR